MGIEGVGRVNYGGANVSSVTSMPQTENIEAPEVAATSTEISDTGNTHVAPDSKANEESQDNSGTEASDEQIKKAIEEINKKATQSEAVFGIHEKTNRITIKIVDKETKDVIKEVPAEKTLDLIAKAWELAGLLVDEKR